MNNAAKIPATVSPMRRGRIKVLPASAPNDFLNGANASLTALRVMERIVDLYLNGEVDRESYFRDRELVKSALLNSSGTTSPFMAGFISTLAEYIDLAMQDGSIPILNNWKPESVMTSDEVRATRAEMFQDESGPAAVGETA